MVLVQDRVALFAETVTIEIPSSRNGGRTNATSAVLSLRPAAGWFSPAFETLSSTCGWRPVNRRIVSVVAGTIAVPESPTRSVARSARRAASSNPTPESNA
jgi:hypothetical protein